MIFCWLPPVGAYRACLENTDALLWTAARLGQRTACSELFFLFWMGQNPESSHVVFLVNEVQAFLKGTRGGWFLFGFPFWFPFRIIQKRVPLRPSAQIELEALRRCGCQLPLTKGKQFQSVTVSLNVHLVSPGE